MVKRLTFISVPALLFIVMILLIPGWTCSQGAQQVAAPSGLQIVSFKVANDNITPGDVPVFTWEAANASAVTITQDGEEIYHIEAVPDTQSGALLTPLNSGVYASTSTEKGGKQSYSWGIYPVGFKGASNGHPSKTIWTFGDSTTTTVPGSAEITVQSPDGQSATAKLEMKALQRVFKLASSYDSSNALKITPPPCIRPSAGEHIISIIKHWGVKNPVVNDGEAPWFEYEVTNARTISIKHGDEFISSVEIISPQVTPGISLLPLTDKAYASSTGESEGSQPYSWGVYPVIYKGSSSGRPATIAFRPDDNYTEDSADIIVCSLTGDIVTDTVKFTIMRTEEQAQPSTAGQPPVIDFFNPSRTLVTYGDSVTFNYRITDADNAWFTCNGSQEAIPTAGSKEIIILKSTCYFIVAVNKAGRTSQSQCITVQSSGVIPPPVSPWVTPPVTPPTPPVTPPPSDWRDNR